MRPIDSLINCYCPYYKNYNKKHFLSAFSDICMRISIYCKYCINNIRFPCLHIFYYTRKFQDVPIYIYLWWNAQNGTKVLPETSHRVFSWSLSSQRSGTANTHAPICFLGKLPGARTRLWASKSSENENLSIYFQTNLFRYFIFG